MAVWDRLSVWWRSLQVPWRRWRIIDQFDAGDEVPERLPNRGVALVGPPESPTWAVFDCPCRSGHRLMVNLDRTRHPYWRVETRKPLSIRPSIDNVTPERRCHFIMSGGKVSWSTAMSEE